MMKVHQYKIDPEEKRDMRHLCPNVIFDWRKITTQWTKKREVCRREPFIGVIDPFPRTVYVNDERNVAGATALLDALIAGERGD